MDPLWIYLMIVILVLLVVIPRRSSFQVGGEPVYYKFVSPEPSQRCQHLGYLGQGAPIDPDSDSVAPKRHTAPSRAHPRNTTNSNELYEKPQDQYNYYVYSDKFDYKPYDWRQHDWRPYWLRRANLAPSAKDCFEYASDNCIGRGFDDYQLCYDQEYAKCPFPKNGLEKYLDQTCIGPQSPPVEEVLKNAK